MPWFRQPSCVSEPCGDYVRTLKFGAKADLIRRAHGVTLAALARMSGVPERTVERICSGHSAPCAAHFVRIVKALNIDLDAIEPEDLEEEGIA